MAFHPNPKKHLGQHFLADANIARKVADGLTGWGDYRRILEVGPGGGMLTRHLIEKPEYLWLGLDVDRESVAYLRERFPQLNDGLILADFLKISLDELPGEGPMAVIGNFPYNISSQILFKVIANRNLVPEMVGMFQKEVALRIGAPPGSKTYGIISVLTQAFFSVEYLFDVPPHVFVPPPRVDSAVIRCRRLKNQELDCDEKLFFAVVKTAFNQRRKTLRNSLKSMDINWDGLPAHLPGERPEQLTVADFVLLTTHSGAPGAPSQ